MFNIIDISVQRRQWGDIRKNDPSLFSIFDLTQSHLPSVTIKGFLLRTSLYTTHSKKHLVNFEGVGRWHQMPARQLIHDTTVEANHIEPVLGLRANCCIQTGRETPTPSHQARNSLFNTGILRPTLLVSS
jgi:hypothetical protein